jgi:hypothetical protein
MLGYSIYFWKTPDDQVHHGFSVICTRGYPSTKTEGSTGEVQPLLPSGKLLLNYGKSPFLMGKSTINGHFQ